MSSTRRKGRGGAGGRGVARRGCTVLLPNAFQCCTRVCVRAVLSAVYRTSRAVGTWYIQHTIRAADTRRERERDMARRDEVDAAPSREHRRGRRGHPRAPARPARSRRPRLPPQGPSARRRPAQPHPDGRPRVQDQHSRPQRSFASVAQLGSWLELMTSAAGLDGERCGVKVALRESARGSSAWRSRWRARGCRPSRARASSGCARRCT